MSKDGEIVDDITHRIQVGCLKWRAVSEVLCDQRVPPKLKGKFYKTTIRPARLFEIECWVVKKQQVTKMSVAEMRMLQWTCGKARKDRIRNTNICDMVGITSIEDNL